MKKFAIIIITYLTLAKPADAQSSGHQWTAQDRLYLVENLTRSRDNLLKETTELTNEQWDFKESTDRWSIREVLEHLDIYELLWQREVSMSLASPAITGGANNGKADSVYVGYIMEEKQHVTTDFTKPFTYSVPMGINTGKNNLLYFVKMRNESIEFIRNTTQDLRAFSLKPGRPNVHQLYIYFFGHTDRHLRQIRQIKQHPNYPK